MARVEVEGLTKRFGRVVAVQDFDLEVREGELVSLLGPSGCGKTTVLRCIAGFERPDAGHIVVDGQVLNDVPPERRNIGMVFQTYA
ncbi:ATP-binding cassette domain-containing protein, partial [Thermoflexus sp.]